MGSVRKKKLSEWGGAGIGYRNAVDDGVVDDNVKLASVSSFSEYIGCYSD